ncbi:hypothetical protein ACTXGZ_12580 [Psychrobacter celer]|uniref:hypothetical protein n=1 Tax=Psychrobacter celer TaxID=306572 RepID=UPI003FCF7289
MAKRTKFSKFRELYNVIEDLADTYTYEGVVEILAEYHDLKLTTGTLTNYLYRHRKELSVATNDSNSMARVNHDINKQKSTNPQDGDSEIDSQDDEEIDYDALLEQFKNKHQTKSLLDK